MTEDDFENVVRQCLRHKNPISPQNIESLNDFLDYLEAVANRESDIIEFLGK